MRRRTEGVAVADAVGDGRVARAERHPADVLIRRLEPLVTEERRARLRAVIARRLESVAVVFDRPYDPHNGAAVLRSCEAFGVQTLHVLERKGTPFAVARSVARGAEKWVDVRRHASAGSLVAWASASATTLVAAHPEGEMDPADLARVPRLAIVVGNERDGIREELEGACAARVRVPMRGFVESLNVSVTAAILLCAATRGRPGDLPTDVQARLYARALYLTVPHAEEIVR